MVYSLDCSVDSACVLSSLYSLFKFCWVIIMTPKFGVKQTFIIFYTGTLKPKKKQQQHIQVPSVCSSVLTALVIFLCATLCICPISVSFHLACPGFIFSILLAEIKIEMSRRERVGEWLVILRQSTKAICWSMYLSVFTQLISGEPVLWLYVKNWHSAMV